MAPLNSAELARFNAAALSLHSIERAEELPGRLLMALRGMIGAEVCSVGLIGFLGEPFLHLHDPPGAIPPAVEEAFFRTLRENPSYGRRSKAASISDFIDRARWHRTGHYAEGFRQIGHEEGLGIDIPVGDGCVIALNNSGSWRRFGAAEKLMSDLLAPHVQAAYGRLMALRAAEPERAAWAVLDPGELRLREPAASARVLLARHFEGRETAGNRLPEPVKGWLRASLAASPGPLSPPAPFRHCRGKGTLELRLSLSPLPGGDPFLLLQERLERGPSLSKREQEILSWVSHGLTNGEIASRLGIEPGTVKRHLENLYAKLGVRNRVEALAVARGKRLIPPGSP